MILTFVKLKNTEFFFFFNFWLHHACEILVPQTGIQPKPPAVEAWSLNHYTTREVPCIYFKLPQISLQNKTISNFFFHFGFS